MNGSTNRRVFVHGGAVAGTGEKGGPFLVHAGNLEKHINYIVSERNAQVGGPKQKTDGGGGPIKTRENTKQNKTKHTTNTQTTTTTMKARATTKQRERNPDACLIDLTNKLLTSSWGFTTPSVTPGHLRTDRTFTVTPHQVDRQVTKTQVKRWLM